MARSRGAQRRSLADPRAGSRQDQALRPDLDPATRTALFAQAAARNRQEQVRAMLAHGMDVHALDDAALNAAANAGHLDMVSLLLDAGADPWALDGRVLVQAARGGHDVVLDRLLDRMAPRERTRAGPAGEPWAALLHRALNAAVLGAHRGSAQRLVDAGADLAGLPALLSLIDAEVHRRASAGGSSPAPGTGHALRQALNQMGQASYYRHMDLVSWLLREGAYDPTMAAGEDGGAFVMAVRAGNMLWVEAILRRTPDLPLVQLDAALAIADSEGFTPIAKVLRPLVVRGQQAVLRDALQAMGPDGVAPRRGEIGEATPEERAMPPGGPVRGRRRL